MIAGDDLFVTVLNTGVQFKMSHENFIQIEGPRDYEFIEKEVERYRVMGWKLSEQLKDISS